VGHGRRGPAGARSARVAGGLEPGQSHRRRAIPPPHILSLRPIDYHDWHAGLITVRPRDPFDAPESAVIEDLGRDFEVVWSGTTQYRGMNAVIRDDGEQYCLARVAE
jgi:hypothetical protein